MKIIHILLNGNLINNVLRCYENYIQARSMKRARDIKEQLIKLLERVEINALDEKLSLKNDETINNIRKSITSGFFYNAAKLHNDGEYKTLKNAHTVQVNY